MQKRKTVYTVNAGVKGNGGRFFCEKSTESLTTAYQTAANACVMKSGTVCVMKQSKPFRDVLLEEAGLELRPGLPPVEHPIMWAVILAPSGHKTEMLVDQERGMMPFVQWVRAVYTLGCTVNLYRKPHGERVGGFDVRLFAIFWRD